MNCMCGKAMETRQINVVDEPISYAVCNSCDYLYLDEKMGGCLRVPLIQVIASSDNVCPKCDGTLMDRVRGEGMEQTTLYSCRKCRGLRLDGSIALLKHGLDLEKSLFGQFLTAVGLLLRDQHQRQKARQLPQSFHVENARPSNYRCPHCRQKLTTYHVYDKCKDAGGEFEICDACFGIWLDHEDLLETKRAESQLKVDYESIEPAERVCPKCREIKLFSMRFQGMPTVIDCCPNCFGTWLDGGELDEFCTQLGRENHDVIDTLVDNAVFRKPAFCKTLKQYSQTLYQLDAKVVKQEQNLEQARMIQNHLVFGGEQVDELFHRHHKDVHITVFWRPMDEVGGDYFDILPLEGDRLLICVADVSGKGLAAALLMANLQALLRTFAQSYGSPAELCAHLNQVLCLNTVQSKYITAFLGILDLNTYQLTYTNAGHNPPLLLRADDEPVWLKTGCTVLGLLSDWEYSQQVVTLGQKDRLLLYTDGASELEDAAGQDFGEQNLMTLIEKTKGRAPEDALRVTIRTLKEYCRGHFEDDTTLMLVNRAK